MHCHDAQRIRSDRTFVLRSCSVVSLKLKTLCKRKKNEAKSNEQQKEKAAYVRQKSAQNVKTICVPEFVGTIVRCSRNLINWGISRSWSYSDEEGEEMLFASESWYDMPWDTPRWADYLPSVSEMMNQRRLVCKTTCTRYHKFKGCAGRRACPSPARVLRSELQ